MSRRYWVRDPRGAALFCLAIALVLVAAFVVGCGKPGTKVAPTEMTARTDAQGVQVVDVDVHSFYFKPSRIIVEVGKPVDLVLHQKPLFVPHNFTLMAEEAGIAVSRSWGFMSFSRTKHARFTPKARGEYEFFCHVGNHHKKGMEGTLVVR